MGSEEKIVLGGWKKPLPIKCSETKKKKENK